MKNSKAYKLPEEIEEAIVAESRSSYVYIHTSAYLAVLAWDVMALRKRAFTVLQL